MVVECARRIKSHFFSVDVAMRSDGRLRVVEIGDGQVSDLVGWEPGRFAELWKQQNQVKYRKLYWRQLSINYVVDAVSLGCGEPR